LSCFFSQSFDENQKYSATLVPRETPLFYFFSNLTFSKTMSQDSTVVPPTPQVSPPTPQVSAPFLDISPELPAQETYQLTNLPPTYYNDQKQSEPTLVRAGLTTQPRLLLMTSIGSFWGFSMGALLGGRQSGLQYLAENAHKLPTTVQGWYFYHKTKNYRMMLGGVKRGIRFAGKTGGLCLLYGALEAALDDVRGEADIINSVTAGITTGTIFSALSKYLRQKRESILMPLFSYSEIDKRII
jgi:hypothetical protein